MDLATYREQKETGMTAEPEVQTEVQDAAEQEVQDEVEDVDTDTEDTEDTETPSDESDEQEDVEVPENQKTAFQKALEREKRKIREAAEQELRTQLEQQYQPHKKFFESLGIDPEQAERAIEEQRIRQQAAELAEQNGWDDDQAQYYLQQQIQQQRQQQEIHELRVSVQINDLADNPEYPGIKEMKQKLTQFIAQNPNLNVEQAYWAVGGKQLADQLRREAEQREIAKRQKPKRTVQSDHAIATTGEKPLPQDILQQARRMGMSEQEARRLMNFDINSLEEYRKQKGRK